MQEHNRRVKAQARERRERITDERQQYAVQFVPLGPVEAKLPPSIRGIVEKVKKANGNFKLLHFTLQFGRLKIEFSQAKGTAETT